MRIFNLTEPLALDGPEGPITQLMLGDSGRGRTLTVVPIQGSVGADVRVKRVGEKGIVLVRGEWPDERVGHCLTVVNTVGAYSRCREYGLLEPTGVTVIATGYIAFGDAGRINGGEEVLAIVEAGGEFRLNSKYDSTWYRWSGMEWTIETPAERRARIALAAAAAGEGEWL
jgi:hypothetical protein